MHEVRRFQAQWEREASVRLRDGNLAAAAAYDRHGRIRGADEAVACDRAASMWLADHLRGKGVLLLAGSNAEAAELSRRVQARLTQMGSVGPPQTVLSDGNHAGIGDLVRARLNTEIDAGGRQLTNRDVLTVTAFRGPDTEVRRQRPDRTWTGTFRVPRTYLAANAELAYAGNVHVAQGRTVDTAHLLVTDSLSRQALYVGMTRGRESNTAHVVTGKTAPPGHQPYQQAAPESVLAGLLQRDAGDLSATMSRGELEARVLQGERAQATAPPDVSGRLRLTAQAEADAWQQSAAAETEHDLMQAHEARALANQMAAEKSRLEAASARYEEWSAKTIGARETAGKAKAELQRRGHEAAPTQTPQPQSTLQWWQELEANIEAVDRALAPAAGRHRRRPAVATSPPPGGATGSRALTPTREFRARTAGDCRARA